MTMGRKSDFLPDGIGICSNQPADDEDSGEQSFVPEAVPPIESARTIKPVPGAAIGGSNLPPNGNEISSGL